MVEFMAELALVMMVEGGEVRMTGAMNAVLDACEAPATVK